MVLLYIQTPFLRFCLRLIVRNTGQVSEVLTRTTPQCSPINRPKELGTLFGRCVETRMTGGNPQFFVLYKSLRPDVYTSLNTP